jgi:hypothetical protein
MKKKLLSLLFIPTLLLCSCKGAKITEEKAKELAAKIVANEDALEGKGTEINVTLKDNKNNVTYQLITDKNENVKFKVKGKADDESVDFVIYTVKNEEHEEVSYIKDYSQETKTYSEHVYSKKETTGYSALVSPYSIQALVPLLMVANFADPVKILEIDEYKNGEYYDDGVTYLNKAEYFSTGERNLTIEITQKYVSGEPIVEEGEEKEDEYSKDMKLTITYDNLVLKSVNATAKSSKGNTGSMKATVNINNSLKVELPKNWKDLLNK